MARKKREMGSGGGTPWLNTFADLMNLLLCFFVMLFAMSDVNAEKFQDMAISMSNSFGIFDGGGKAFGDGPLIGSGMSQLSNLDEYYTTMGKMGQDSEEGKDPTKEDSNKKDLEEAYEVLQGKMQEVSDEMYQTLEELTEHHNMGNYVDLSIDTEYRYVQLTMKGSVLFDSGKADILPEAKPILLKLGDILSHFKGYTIEIIGHTDNVPQTNPEFKDNNWLSSARALNAAEFLIKNNDLDPKMVKYSGRGEYEPIADNGTPEGRAKNRRVEIRIYNEYSGR